MNVAIINNNTIFPVKNLNIGLKTWYLVILLPYMPLFHFKFTQTISIIAKFPTNSNLFLELSYSNLILTKKTM